MSFKLAPTYVHNRSFARVVPDEAGSRSRSPNTRNVDNAPSTALLKVRDKCLHAQVDTLQVDIDDPVKLSVGDLNRRLVWVARPGIINEDVCAAKSRHSGLQSGLPAAYGCDVCNNGREDVGGFSQGLDQVVSVQVYRDNLSALGKKDLGCGEAKPGRSAY